MNAIDIAKAVEVPDCDCPPMWWGEYRRCDGRPERVQLCANRRLADRHFAEFLAQRGQSAYAQFSGWLLRDRPAPLLCEYLLQFFSPPLEMENFRRAYSAVGISERKKMLRKRWFEFLRAAGWNPTAGDLIPIYPNCEHVRSAPDMPLTEFQAILERADPRIAKKLDRTRIYLPEPKERIKEPIRQNRVGILAGRLADGRHLWHWQDSRHSDVAIYERIGAAGSERHRNGADRQAELTVESS